MRERRASKSLGLVLGAGISKPLGYPSWRELVERIALDPEVSGMHLLSVTSGISETAKTQMLLQHFRTKRLDQLDVSASARNIRKINGEWRRIVQRALYRDAPKSAHEICSKHPYIAKYVDIIAETPMTVNYNFDDTIEKLLSAKDQQSGSYGRGFETAWDAALQSSRGSSVIYHPNGFLSSNIMDRSSEDLVFSEDSFADRLIESMAGHHASLLHHLGRTTCLFIGLSLQDETLRMLLRQSARINPGQYHYYVSWRDPAQTRDEKAESAVRQAHFDVYNLITLFLDDAEISSLGELLTAKEDVIVRAAEEEGVPLKFVYYLTGAIGAGKTTALSYLRSLITYEEWTESRIELLGKSWRDLDEGQRNEVDDWILRQFVIKNNSLLERREGIIVVDRPPLDPLSFTDKPSLASKARKMIEAFRPGKAKRHIVSGKVILLKGEPNELEGRVIGRHKESSASVIEELQKNLMDIYDSADIIETTGSSIHSVVKSISKKIHLEDYSEIDLDGYLCSISKEVAG